MVEMADYFDTVILPRIKKVIFSDKWKDGKPIDGDGISHMVKYFKLEQYEDQAFDMVVRNEKSG